jgi:hypothetical protein
MHHVKAILLILLSFGLGACASVHGGAAAEPAAPTEPTVGPGGDAPVVLELFTSQGCSSCPAADRVLASLGHDEGLRGRVVPLAFHVDYWNYIGWADPFSSADWSARQEAYAHRFKLDSVYTPQIVVNGRSELNGSDEDGIRREIAAASRGPSGRVALSVARDGGGALAADVSAETPEAIEAGELSLVVVVYESGISTAVKRGENSGRTLENDFVVRRVARAFSFKPVAGAKQAGRVQFDLDPSWKAGNLGVAAFLQDPQTLRIYGAAVR